MKKTWNLALVVQKILKSIVLAYIYQLTKYGDLMSCGSKDIFKNISYTNSYHDFTDLVNHEMVKNTKTLISWELNITFPLNKNILNVCLKWQILRNCCFVLNVIFKFPSDGDKKWGKSLWPDKGATLLNGKALSSSTRGSWSQTNQTLRWFKWLKQNWLTWTDCFGNLVILIK